MKYFLSVVRFQISISNGVVKYLRACRWFFCNTQLQSSRFTRAQRPLQLGLLTV